MIISLVGTIIAVFLQEQNLNFLNDRYPSSNGLLTSADEASYFAPAINWLEKGVWKDNSIGQSAHFQRTPGYGGLFVFCLLVAGKKAFWLLKIIQILAFSMSILLFGKVLEKLLSNSNFALFGTAVFAFYPCFSGFMYFTLTESITPFLVLWSIHACIQFAQKQTNFSWNFMISNGIMLLFRPQLIVLLLAFAAFYFFQRQSKKSIFALIALMPLLFWNVRTIAISGSWLGIHPIYSSTNNSLFRPSHESMTNLFRIWEADGAKFHATIKILASDTSDKALYLALNQVPKTFQEEVKPIFQDYQKIQYLQHSRFDSRKEINEPFREELIFQKKIQKKITALKSTHKWEFYVKTPLQSLKKLMVSSHLNLGIYQFKYRGLWWMECLRWISLGTILMSFLAVLISMFDQKKTLVFYLSCAIVLNLGYLVFVQRMNEERYLTPFLPIALLVLFFTINKIMRRNKKSLLKEQTVVIG